MRSSAHVTQALAWRSWLQSTAMCRRLVGRSYTSPQRRVLGRHLVRLTLACTLALVVRVPVALAVSPPIEALWENVGPSPVADALVVNGRTYAAGLSFYRIGGGSTPAYSLSLDSTPSPGTPLEGVAPAASVIDGLPEATYLAGCSAKRDVAAPLHPLVAAAYQVAIWHFTNEIGLTRRTVPNPAILSQAQALASEAEQAVASHAGYCTPVEGQGFDAASYDPELAVETGSQSEGRQASISTSAPALRIST